MTQGKKVRDFTTILSFGLAVNYAIPKSTLGDRISGRVVPGSSSGPRKLLSIEEEEDLVVFLRRCAMFGYPKSRKELMELVQRILEGKGIEYQIQMDGGEHFVKGILTLHYVHLQHYHKTEY